MGEQQEGHLVYQVRVMKKKLTVAEDLAELTYDELGELVMHAVDMAFRDHRRWKSPSPALAESIRKRFMGSVVNAIHNKHQARAVQEERVGDTG